MKWQHYEGGLATADEEMECGAEECQGRLSSLPGTKHWLNWAMGTVTAQESREGYIWALCHLSPLKPDWGARFGGSKAAKGASLLRVAKSGCIAAGLWMEGWASACLGS